MKQYIELIKDSFVDYAGKEHFFVIAAISIPDINNVVANESLEVIDLLPKKVCLGISICNPADTFNEKIGAFKATARARNSQIALYASDPGLINTTMVRALLMQEAEYVKKNPEKYIKGYRDAEAKYTKAKEMEKLSTNFSELEKAIVNNIQKNPEFLDNVSIYLDWLDKQKKCEKSEL